MSISKNPLSFGLLKKSIVGGLRSAVNFSWDKGKENAEDHRAIPLCWAAATRSQSHLNLGDALSPVIVSALSNRPVRHVSFHSTEPRMSAIGTVGQSLVGGQVDVWGTGCSSFANPLAAPGAEKQPYIPPAGTTLRVHATRGPISWRLLTGTPPGPDAVFGDPGCLLPHFYNPTLTKTTELGVVVHLSELADRAFEAHPKPNLLRYLVAPQFQGKVRLINTITPIGADGLRAKLDEILSCKRIISTSLHGLIFAEAYKIPCLYIQARPGPTGLMTVPIHPDDGMNLRMSDFYAGLREEAVTLYNQPRHMETDWDAVITAIDQAWRPKAMNEGRLVSAFPYPAAPIVTSDIFAEPLIVGTPFQHVHKT